MLSEFADPQRAPELLSLRDRIRSWRFYDQFRTDARAPARGSHIGTRTPVLSHDGADVAAALQTITENGDDAGLAAAVSGAFPGSRLNVARAEDGRLPLSCTRSACCARSARPSCRTARSATCCGSRPCSALDRPSLLVLNEPETSLHPDLLAPLGQLISAAAGRTQVITVTHSASLIDALGRAAHQAGTELTAIELTKDFGETRVVGREPLDQPGAGPGAEPPGYP